MDKLLAVAEAELSDDSVLRERLLNAQMRLELGELSFEEFGEIEQDVFDRLRELKGVRSGGPISMTSSDGGSVTVEASVSDEFRERRRVQVSTAAVIYVYCVVASTKPLRATRPRARLAREKRASSPSGRTDISSSATRPRRRSAKRRWRRGSPISTGCRAQPSRTTR